MKLKIVLLINAISSGVTGVLLVSIPTFFANLFKVKSTNPFIEVGVFLIAFSLFVMVTAFKKPIRHNWTKVIIGLDITWVVASGITILLLISSISIFGSIVILAIAAWVGLMAYLQYKALRNI